MNQEQQLLEWKKQYGYVYYTEVNGNEFIYRLIGAKEYETLEQQSEDVTELDEKICRLCILSPELMDWEDAIYAGYVSTLGEVIREESMITPREDGSNDVHYVIQQQGNELSQRFILQLPLIIKRCFTEYTLKEIEAMSLKEQVDLYVKAAWMLKEFDGIELSLNEPE